MQNSSSLIDEKISGYKICSRDEAPHRISTHSSQSVTILPSRPTSLQRVMEISTQPFSFTFFFQSKFTPFHTPTSFMALYIVGCDMILWFLSSFVQKPSSLLPLRPNYADACRVKTAIIPLFIVHFCR
jgi:hypothetical protein